MIQRKQTLFLVLLVLSALVLIIIPANSVVVNGTTHGISLSALNTSGLAASAWLYTGIALNVAALCLSVVTIFLYRQRALQIRLCFILMLLELGVTLIVSLCPLVIKTDNVISIENSGMASIIGVIGMISAYLAARYIKRDIELLKSADRIR